MIARTLSLLIPLAHIIITMWIYPGDNYLPYLAALGVAWALFIGGLWLLWIILRRHHRQTLTVIEAEERLVEIKHSPRRLPAQTIDAEYTYVE